MLSTHHNNHNNHDNHDKIMPDSIPLAIESWKLDKLTSVQLTQGIFVCVRLTLEDP